MTDQYIIEIKDISVAAASAVVRTDHHHRGILIHRIESIRQLDRIFIRALS